MKSDLKIIKPSLFVTALVFLTCFSAFGQTNLALNKAVTVSSTEAAFTGASAVDGNTATRWSTAFSDPQWIRVDLGATYSIARVVLRWEAAYGKSFTIQTSADGTTFTNIYTTTAGTGGVNDLTVSGSGRYVRMYGTVRGTAYGYSLWEFEVYGATTATATPTRTPAPTLTPTRTPTPAVATATPTTAVATVTPTPVPATTNVALNKTATASSSELTTTTANYAVDGNTTGTRWSSAFSDPQWLMVDLGATYNITRVVIRWEAAYASAFTVQVSSDASVFTNIYSTTAGTGGVSDLTVSATGRYVRVYATVRATAWGDSIWELEVYGTLSGTTSTNTPTGAVSTATVTPTTAATFTPTPSATATSGPLDFGPNVYIFDPTMSMSSIQSTCDTIFNNQVTNQFGTQRYALLFKPGSYSVNVSVGFYTSVVGLGQSPDNVTITGSVRCEADWFAGNATQNFWRSAENYSDVPTFSASTMAPAGTETWATSQAAPMRRVHIKGNMTLWDPNAANYDGSWTSGGFIADSKIDGNLNSASQQQYLTRNIQMGSWTGANWNMVFVGDVGAPAASWPDPPMTVVAQTPTIREKPFLYIDGSGNYFIFKPAIRTNSSGYSWAGGLGTGTSISLSQFYVAKPNIDTAASMNAALAAGKHLLLTPGIYQLNEPIQVNRADAIVYGMGLATLIPVSGTAAIKVADVDGVTIAGLLLDAGATNSPVLLEVGPTGSSLRHNANPIFIFDVFCRVGGAAVGNATVSMIINSHDTVIDHTWIWRADHTYGVGWSTNNTTNGLIVNGNYVTFYGLFVEHYHKYQTVWNGNYGKVYFYQSEAPYDPPNQAAYMNGSVNGYASYKVANTVTNHEAWGLGIYCYFNVDPTVKLFSAIEAPSVAGVKFHHMVTVSLGGVGEITHIINSLGGPSNTAANVAKWAEFP